MCSGLGGGAKGFRKAKSRVGEKVATWRCIGGVDNDPAACRDFKSLVGADCTLMDLFTRERIGNAVPPDAAEAIAEVMGTTLLLAESGETFQLSATPVWVRPIAIALTLPPAA
ncbi:hypothetical protein BX604_7539 [Burkholderia sp. JKS000303]|nr:hypothetical protein BX604_7539 [Burkholderia sp. JKS000303]